MAINNSNTTIPDRISKITELKFPIAQVLELEKIRNTSD